MNKMVCPKCGSEVWDNTKQNEKRIKDNKPLNSKGEVILRPDYSCKDDVKCKWVQWPERPRTAQEEKILHSSDNLPPIKEPIFEGTKTLVNKFSPHNTVEIKKSSDKDASIIAQVLVKAQARAGGFNKDSDDIRNDIYNAYIFYRNRLEKEDLYND